jgi:hypothetical protein
MALFTKDPDKAALKLTTSDPNKGVGAGTIYTSVPDDQLTEEQKAARYRSGAMKPPERKSKRQPQGMKKGGSVSASKRADGCAKKGKTKGRMV